MIAETIRQLPVLSEEETSVFRWSDDVFNTAGYGYTMPQCGRPDTHFILEIEGKPACRLNARRRAVDVAGQQVLVAGFGAILTRPEAQGKGYARRLMQHALASCEREWKVEAGMIFCLDHMTRYYQSLGWQRLEVPVMIEQPGGVIETPTTTLVWPLAGRQWPHGMVVINGLPW